MKEIMSSDMKNKFTIVFIGRSGSGKGTLAKFILQKLGTSAYHIETGQILRSLIEKPNPTTALIKQILKEGQFVPSWIPSFLWIKEFIEKGVACKHLVFDGSPRMISEAINLDEVLKWHGRSPSICIFVEVGEKEATKRLILRGRVDDNMLAIKNRMKSFSKFVMPVMEYYKKHKRLILVNGNQSPEKVWEEVNFLLKKRLGSKWR